MSVRLARLIVLLAAASLVGACSTSVTGGTGGTATPATPTRSGVARTTAATHVDVAQTAIAQAEARARASGKLVLVDFGAGWCPDCRALDRLYRAPAVAPILARHYLVVHVDVGHFDKNMGLSAHYGRAANVGIPALVVLTGHDRMLVSTSNGSFANARTMTPAQVAAFLKKWDRASP